MDSNQKCSVQECTPPESFFLEEETASVCEENASVCEENASVCEEHLGPSQEQYCTGVLSSVIIEDVLDLVEACITNFMVDQESSNGDNKEQANIFVDEIQNKTQKLLEEFKLATENNHLEDFKSIENNAKDLLANVQSSELFCHFCVQNYFMTICESKKIDKKSISRFILYPNDEDLMSNKLKQKEQELKALNEKFGTFKVKAVSNMKLTSESDLKKIYEMVTETKMREQEVMQVLLDCKSKQDIDFIQAMKGQTLPNLKELAINKIDSNLPLVKEFIFSSFSQKVLRFDLNWGGDMVDIESVIEVIMNINPRIAEELCLYSFEINQSQLKILLQTVCRNKYRLGFLRCTLKFDSVPDLQYCLKGSKIKHIVFNYCGSSRRCDWRNHPERFSSLIEGLGQNEDIKKSLKTIQLNECRMPMEFVEETLDKFGFGHVKIRDHSM